MEGTELVAGSAFVSGVPMPQGSKNAYRRGNKVVLVESSKGLPGWRTAVREGAAVLPRLVGEVHVELIFAMPRPKSHYRTGRFAHLLKPSAPLFHSVKPDVDKLERAVFDALTQAGVVEDDCRIVSSCSQKVYSLSPGVLIEVMEVSDRVSLPHIVPAALLGG